MCTAVSMTTGCHYFGRTLDLEYHYSESVTVTSRRFPLEFRCSPALSEHYAYIGMATVIDGHPLYYDAVNEKGLGMASLNFPGNACYLSASDDKDNIAPFEMIPWILSRCASVAEARAMLERTNVVNIDFREDMPLTPLHWMIADGEECIVVEPMSSGLVIYDNPVRVMTNNPTFDMQLMNMNNYMHLSAYAPVNSFSPDLELTAVSRGAGAIGLPGDLSSMSRFVRAAFTLHNSVCGDGEEESVGQFFHILGSVSQTKGCVRLEDGCVTTVYSSCFSAGTGIYYYTTYGNRRICGVDMNRENLDGSELVSYPLMTAQDILMQN